MRTTLTALASIGRSTTLTGFFGAGRHAALAAIIVVIGIAVMAAGCGSANENEDYDRYEESSRSYEVRPTATAITITASQPAPTAIVITGSAPAPTTVPMTGSYDSAYEEAPPAPGGPITFNDYAQSGWVWADQDNTSTFSLDTDRTSFALALNWAQSGYEIDPDSVRAEEWINAFNYDYPEPASDDSFGITTDVFEHPLDSAFQMVRLGFQAPRVEDTIPVNVTLVLDASGSMADGNRVDIAREAAETIRESLTGRDRIAVVQFSSDVINDLTVEHTDPDDRDVRRSIDRLTPRASTNVQAGLNEGVWLADRARRERPNAYNYIILMSDGVANVDATDPFAILESAYDRNARNPLRLITIGVGISNYNDVLLEQLAQHGNGWYRYLNDTDHAEQTFRRDNWLAISKPFADQTRAQVRWNPDVVDSWRMIGYENRVTSDQSFTENRKEFAEIPAGTATTVFFEVRLRDDMRSRLDTAADLGTVDLRWVDPVTGASLQQSQWMDVRLDRQLGRGGDAHVEFGAIVALAADRYASLPYTDARGAEVVQHELSVLSDRLESLDGELGRLDSYNDFRYVLSHMVHDLPAAPARPSSGYSN